MTDFARRDAGVFSFGDCRIDFGSRELVRGGEQVSIEPKAFRLLVYLIENRDRAVSKEELQDEIWPKTIVTEAALTRCVSKARLAVGDDSHQQQVIKTVQRHGYRFVGLIQERASPSTAVDRAPAVPVRFVIARGGVRLAIAEAGSGPPLLKVANWMTHVDHDANSPVWGHWVRDLSRNHRFIRYDARGCGLSDRDLAGMALDDLDLWVDDLVRVADLLELDRVALLGLSQGGPVAIAFANRFPDRVSHLILHGTYARGMNRRDDALQMSQASLQVDIARFGWASKDGRFLETFTRQFIPDAGSEEQRWFSKLQKESCEAETAPKLEAAMHNVDVQDLAAGLEVPTLVTHCIDEVGVPFDEGRRLAGLIPDATFLPLQCANHVMLERDSAWREFVAAVDEFTRAS